MKEIIVRWSKLSNETFYATISWDGYIDENDKFVWGSDGEVLIQRDRLEWLIEGVMDYFQRFSERHPYLDLASKESDKKAQDITDLVKSEINRRQNESK